MPRLGDVCTVVSGTTPKTSIAEYWDGDINWITPAELNEDTVVINESKRKITDAGVRSCGLSPFPAGTVILSSRAPIGKTAIAGTEMYCNQGFKNLICSEQIFNKYLFWFLRCNTEMLNSLGRGATFKEISKSIVENIEIPLPDLPTQRRIAATLDKVSEGIAVCRQMLADLDVMVKARFVEMFGDMILNPNGWERVALGTVCDVRDGTHDSPKYFEEGFPLVTSKNVTGGKVDFSDCNLICEEDYRKICERSKVDLGDILMPMIGTVGNPVIVDTVVEFAIKNVALIKFHDDSKVINVFVKFLLKSDYFDIAVLSKIRGGTQKFISLGDIRKLEICLPPMERQFQFATFIGQTEKSRFVVQQQLAELETLKKSMMQEYFG